MMTPIDPLHLPGRAVPDPGSGGRADQDPPAAATPRPAPPRPDTLPHGTPLPDGASAPLDVRASRYAPKPLAAAICATAPVGGLVIAHVGYFSLDAGNRPWQEMAVIWGAGVVWVLSAVAGAALAVRGATCAARSIGLGTALGALTGFLTMCLQGVALVLWTFLTFPVQR